LEDEANRSRILRKNLNVAVKFDEKKLNSQILTKESLNKARESTPEILVEKKLKIDDTVTEVVSRRANRGAIQSTENLNSNLNSNNQTTIIQAVENQNDLGMKIKRIQSNPSIQDSNLKILATKNQEKFDDDQEEEESEYEEEEEEEDEESEEMINVIKRPVFIQKEDRFVMEKDQ
jgi:hypothetical protein